MKITKYFSFLLLLIAPASVLANSQAAVSYEKFQRLNNPENKTDYNDWALVEGRKSGFVNEYKYHLEGKARVYINNDNDFNFSVPEAYVEKKDRHSRMSIGRQILNWNENEKYWLLDTINPNQGLYLLGEQKEGLVGFQYEKRFRNNVTTSLFASMLNIPALNPAIEIEDGRITSKSEWVRLPPSAVRIEGDTTAPVYYKMNDPDISDIIINKSLGGRVAYSWDKDRSEISGYMLYKPENNLRANAEAFIREENITQVEVISDPVINHHMIYGVQLKKRFGDVQSIFGFEIDDPNANFGEDFDVLNEEKQKNNAKVADVFLIEPKYERESYFHVSSNLNRGKYMLSLNYIHLLSSNKRGNDDFYSDTVKWKSTIGARARYYFDDFFNVMADIRYDFVRGDNILKAEANYKLFRDATFNVGMELIRSPKTTSYWSAYRANDAVYTQLKYSF